MSTAVSVTDLVRNFADYVNRVAYRHESFTLMRGSKPVAELRPTPEGRLLADLPSLMSSLPHLDPADAEELARDVDIARDELASHEVRDPWES